MKAQNFVLHLKMSSIKNSAGQRSLIFFDSSINADIFGIARLILPLVPIYILDPHNMTPSQKFDAIRILVLRNITEF